ncbi:hypothetical protein ACQEU6_22210 [Spirillospora sp. CA-108201]
MAVAANAAGAINGYFLVAVGVTEHVGPVTTAFVFVLAGTSVFWLVYRPSVRSPWPVWKQAVQLGTALGTNHVAFQFVLRWVRLQVMESLAFLFTATFMLGADVVRDVRRKTYSTVLWPIAAGLGIWALTRDTVEGAGEGVFSDAVPRIRVVDLQIPGWVLGVGALAVTAATYAFAQKRLEILDVEIKGKANTLSGFPTLAILAVTAWTMEGGWKGMTADYWPYLLYCVASGLFGALCGGIVRVKAYERGLRASTDAMLLPLRTLLGTSVGMLVAGVAPGPSGLGAIGLILAASYGAAKIQSRKSGSD